MEHLESPNNRPMDDLEKNDATPTWQLAPIHETAATAARTSQESIEATPTWQLAPTQREN